MLHEPWFLKLVGLVNSNLGHRGGCRWHHSFGVEDVFIGNQAIVGDLDPLLLRNPSRILCNRREMAVDVGLGLEKPLALFKASKLKYKPVVLPLDQEAFEAG